MVDEQPPRPLAATEFEPLDARGARRRLRVSPMVLGLGAVSAFAALALLYLFSARAVIFRLDPGYAEISVSGLAFHIGDNFLLLPGEHEVTARAEGYHPLETAIEVSDERTQEIDLALEPLPGRLEVASTLEDIEVRIDDEPAGTVPGIIEGIPRGSHIIEFSRHRYFPLRQEIEIEGLGRTQTMTVELEPAWGRMHFTSVPGGAELSIDGQPVGTTPLTTEVLETGSRVSVAADGYKTWEQTVTVKAGTSEVHPPIELVVATGTVDITSSPRGAQVSIDDEFQGSTPLTVELTPLRDHRVEFFLNGYRRAVRRVEVEPEEHASLAVNLQPIIGRIRLAVEPPDAEVLVDGRSRGPGGGTLELTATEHEITVRKPGFVTQAVTITPKPEQDQSLDVRLLTEQQAYWAARPPRITSPVGSGLKLFRPDITFTLGAPRREPGRRANEVQRKVRLERPFYLGTHEVSNAEFRRWRAQHTSGALRGQTLDREEQPVVNVSWQDAAKFCNWLSLRAGLPLFYVEERGLVTGFDAESHGYRLPTEAEWAFAARIGPDGNPMMFPWGTQSYPPVEVVDNYADRSAAGILSFTLTGYDDGFPVSAPVGEFAPNHNGLYAMSGNVSEWIHDVYEIRQVLGEPELDPTGPATGDRHVIRGANWARASRSELRLSYRNAGLDGNPETGIRIARYVDPPGEEP